MDSFLYAKQLLIGLHLDSTHTQTYIHRGYAYWACLNNMSSDRDSPVTEIISSTLKYNAPRNICTTGPIVADIWTIMLLNDSDEPATRRKALSS